MNKRRRYKAKRKRREAKQPITLLQRIGNAMSYRDAIMINGKWY